MAPLRGRIRVAVPRVGIGEGVRQRAWRWVVHELATNSLKYGALSTEAGILDIAGTQKDDAIPCTVAGSSHGGPPRHGPAPDRGWLWRAS